MTRQPLAPRRRRHSGRIWWVAVLALFLAYPHLARAGAVECINHHSEGQLLRDAARFLEAREHFVSCADSACPGAIAAECAALLAELERAIPTLVLAARDERRRDLAGVRVELDGKPLEDALNGRAILVDPGPHRLRFIAPDGRVQEIDAVALESIKARPIEVQFPARATQAPSPERVASSAPPAPALDSTVPPTRSRPTLAYVLGGAGIIALAGAGYLAWTGRSQREELADTCAPSCTDQQVNPVRSKYLAADILLALGVTSLGAGAYFYFQAPDPAPSPAQGRGLVVGVRSAF